MTKERISSKIPLKEHNRHRLRRVENWLEAANAVSRSSSDDYASDYQQFIFLWIALNAAYGVDEGQQQTTVPEIVKIHDFLDKIIYEDEKTIENSVKRILEARADDIDHILKNKYTDPAYWRNIHDILPATPHYQDASPRLREIMKLFERLYQIRNQVFHGSMTYSKGLGRTQIRQASHILSALMPVILDIMKKSIRKSPQSPKWGRVHYPYPDPGKFQELPDGGR